MLECVLFDLDGLLVDSEPLQLRSFQQAFKSFGVTLEPSVWFEWQDAGIPTARWIEDKHPGLDPEEFREVKKVIYEELIEGEMVLKPGARKLVEECSSEFKLAVVSGSRRESIEACLGRFDLQRWISLIVSGSELGRSKPLPDPYLEAMRVLNTDPSGAIALEDSTIGFRAARAAGLACIVCPEKTIPRRSNAFEGAALVVESLLELNAEGLRSIHQESRDLGDAELQDLP